jgi:hypothetical protein
MNSDTIFDSVKAGDFTKIKMLLKDNPELVSSENRYGSETALHMAVTHKTCLVKGIFMGRLQDNYREDSRAKSSLFRLSLSIKFPIFCSSGGKVLFEDPRNTCKSFNHLRSLADRETVSKAAAHVSARPMIAAVIISA